MSERRGTKERRTSDNTPPEKIDREAERRWGDRRDSPRVPMSFLVRDHGEDNLWEERQGDLSIGGIHWLGRTPPKGSVVDVRFRLPGIPKEIRAQGEIIRLVEANKQIAFHLRFTEVDVESELALARFLDEWLKSHPDAD